MFRENSDIAFKNAKQVLVGGVNSPVRAFKSVGCDPLFIKKAKDAYVWDVDDNCYIDYVGSWGPAIVGHAHAGVLQAIKEVAESGFSFGAPTIAETELAEKICDIFPSIEKVRFVSSGTEACMSAIRLARAWSGKDKFIKFTGCYHGHADAFLVKAGSGVATLGLPNSPGVPAAATQDTLLARFNNFDSVEKLFADYPNDIGAVIIEPYMGNGGFIPANPDFLVQLREWVTC